MRSTSISVRQLLKRILMRGFSLSPGIFLLSFALALACTNASAQTGKKQPILVQDQAPALRFTIGRVEFGIRLDPTITALSSLTVTRDVFSSSDVTTVADEKYTAFRQESLDVVSVLSGTLGVKSGSNPISFDLSDTNSVTSKLSTQERLDILHQRTLKDVQSESLDRKRVDEFTTRIDGTRNDGYVSGSLKISNPSLKTWIVKNIQVQLQRTRENGDTETILAFVVANSEISNGGPSPGTGATATQFRVPSSTVLPPVGVPIYLEHKPNSFVLGLQKDPGVLSFQITDFTLVDPATNKELDVIQQMATTRAGTVAVRVIRDKSTKEFVVKPRGTSWFDILRFLNLNPRVVTAAGAQKLTSLLGTASSVTDFGTPDDALKAPMSAGAWTVAGENFKPVLSDEAIAGQRLSIVWITNADFVRANPPKAERPLEFMLPCTANVAPAGTYDVPLGWWPFDSRMGISMRRREAASVSVVVDEASLMPPAGPNTPASSNPLFLAASEAKTARVPGIPSNATYAPAGSPPTSDLSVYFPEIDAEVALAQLAVDVSVSGDGTTVAIQSVLPANFFDVNQAAGRRGLAAVLRTRPEMVHMALGRTNNLSKMPMLQKGGAATPVSPKFSCSAQPYDPYGCAKEWVEAYPFVPDFEVARPEIITIRYSRYEPVVVDAADNFVHSADWALGGPEWTALAHKLTTYPVQNSDRQWALCERSKAQ